MGELSYCEVVVTGDGMSKGWGLAEYLQEEDAERAIRKLNELPLLGRKVFLRYDRQAEDAALSPKRVSGFGGARRDRDEYRERDRSDRPPADGHTLFIGNVRFRALFDDAVIVDGDCWAKCCCGA